jgi:RNA polymerase sigma-70 factor, ECF subfamily
VNSPDCTDGSDSSAVAEKIAKVHAECSEQLLRLAWAILRDWGLAADSVQETFALFAQKYETIEEQHQQGWLFKTVQFQALNLRRSQLRSSHLLDRIREQPSAYVTNASNADPAYDPERQEQIEQLREAIDALPPEQRQIVQRRMADEQGFAEIAKHLNLPLGTVLSRMRLALEKLRRKLSSDEH